ncbi:MAG: ABC transporter permease [Dorea sp.]|jgi:putative ABC transport system permease protein|nr:ABC transporter permease [Dorea sp.]MCI9247673.1 ABC transporter permease [Dorea sp.]
MSSSIYSRLAVTNLKNNRKTYIPYIFTAMLMAMMYYMLDELSRNSSVGWENVRLILSYAVEVVMVFSVIFLFYTNSFLMKRRKKEVGMYNILGMGKAHIAKMFFVETLITSSVSIGAGIAGGILLGKLMWLMLLKILHYDVNMDFAVSGAAVVHTLTLFVAIFGLTLIYNLWQVKLANPVELLRGGNEGEREPKTKWLLAAAGVLLTGYGYYVALVTESPLKAIQLFFVAVICVILGTYALFVAGSVALLKMLKKKKSFYYQSKYFTAVSGMIYRMKQNAVGLANICILSTMVLVMISTTICMYMGMDDILTTRFPREFEVTSFYPDSETKENVRGIIEEEAKRGGVSVKDRMEYHCGGIAVLKEGNEFKIAEDEDVYSGNEDILELKMIPLEDYNALEGRNVSLGDDEVLIYNPDSKAEKMGGTLRIEGVSYKIQEELETFLLEEKNESRVIGCKYIIVKDEEKIQELLNLAYERLKDENPQLDEIKVEYKVCFDLEGADKDVRKTETVIKNRVKEEVGSSYCDGREIERESFYLLYGGLFFIGLYLGFMFLIATVLIIYYKQISEGHDDRERYQIMQKVGMSKKEVRQSIRSQVLMVFFLPLAAAVLHIAVAFKVITKLLVALNMVNVSLFLTCTVATVVVFAVFYAAVFGVTAREYYRIVG